MLENLINDLLDLAKMENNSFKFDNDYFSLPETIFQAFQMLNFSANERGVKLQAVVDQKQNLDLVNALQGDQRRFVQTLLNFLSNALKFTDKDGVITVLIKVLDHQLIGEDSMSEVELESMNDSDFDQYVSRNFVKSHD